MKPYVLQVFVIMNALQEVVEYDRSTEFIVWSSVAYHSAMVLIYKTKTDLHA